MFHLNGKSSMRIKQTWLLTLLTVAGVGLLLYSILMTAESQPVSSKSPSVISNVAEFFAEFPMRFHTNAGEFGRGVEYFSKGYQFDLLFTHNEVLLNLYSDDNNQQHPDDHIVKDGISQVGIKFLDREGMPVIVGNHPTLPGDLVNKDSLADKEPGFLELRYKNVYPGVDVYFYGKQKQLFYEFVLTESADSGAVRMQIVNSGEDARVNVDIHGNVAIICESKRMKINKPNVYRMINNEKIPVSGYFFVTRNNELRFKEVGRV